MDDFDFTDQTFDNEEDYQQGSRKKTIDQKIFPASITSQNAQTEIQELVFEQASHYVNSEPQNESFASLVMD